MWQARQVGKPIEFSFKGGETEKKNRERNRERERKRKKE